MRNQLNKELKIKGFKITKQNMRIVERKKVGDLHLKQTKVRTEEDMPNDSRRDLEIEDKISDLRDDIEELKEKLKLLTDSYSNVVEVLNSLSTSMSSGL